MRLITLKVTFHELELLTTLVADQLFRREFIDPRLSGSNANPAEMSLGKKLVERLRLLADRAKYRAELEVAELMGRVAKP